MKTILSFAFLHFTFTCLTAQSNIQQSLSVNGTGAAADASAQLDVSSNTKGILIPRMISLERISIASPATGLLVYDTSNNGFWFYNGVVWIDLSAPRLLIDTDGDTRIEVEQSPDEDMVRINLAGSERLRLRQNASGSTMVEFPNNGDDVYLGTSAGQSNTSGDNNTAVGNIALATNTTGGDNTAVGAFAMSSNTVGGGNTGIGKFALTANIDGGFNTATGASALSSNTDGNNNTAFGFQTLQLTSSGSFNTAVGTNALRDNVSFGNTAVGNTALQSNTTGDANTAVGGGALLMNTEGFDNTAVGGGAMSITTTGGNNTAVGADALDDNITGSNNTAIGDNALTNNTTGSSNTALGFNARVTAGGQINATAIGARAEVAGNNNLVLGSIIGVNGATSSVNVGIGITNPALRLHIVGGSDVTPTGGGYIQTGSTTGNNVAIDENEIMARNNGAVSTLFLNNDGGDVKIGNASTNVGIGRTPVTNNLEVEGVASKSSAGDWLANSDARLKKNITPLDSREMLEKLLSLQGVTYEWNDDQTGSKRPEGIQYGFTAQNILTAFPTLVEEDKLGYLQTAYGTYDAMTVEAIRALNEEIGNLKSEIHASKAENAALRMQLDNIATALQGAGIAVEK